MNDAERVDIYLTALWKVQWLVDDASFLDGHFDFGSNEVMNPDLVWLLMCSWFWLHLLTWWASISSSIFLVSLLLFFYIFHRKLIYSYFYTMSCFHMVIEPSLLLSDSCSSIVYSYKFCIDTEFDQVKGFSQGFHETN